MNEKPPNLGASCATAAADVQGLVIKRGETTILDSVSCRLEAGQYTAILGPNGCGKTTFARCLLGQMYATKGTVTVLGETLGRTDIRKLRRRIGIVNPTTDTGGYHVMGAVVDAELSATQAVITGYFGTVGLYNDFTDAQQTHARDLLSMVGLSQRMDHRFGLLSTGEQRRALIARALVHLPELLILDEPTAGLDLAGREQVLATIEQVLSSPHAPAILMITHHVEELSPNTHRVLLMKSGRFIADGPTKSVLTPEKLSETFDCKVELDQSHGRYWLKVLPEVWDDLIKP